MISRGSHDSVVECRDLTSRVPQFISWYKQSKFLTAQITTIPPPIPLHQSSIPQIVRVKTRRYDGTSEENGNWDPDVSISIHCAGKRNILTGQIVTIPPPNPVNQTKISEIVRGYNKMSLWHSSREEELRSRGPQFTSWCRVLTGLIRTILSPVSLHQS